MALASRRVFLSVISHLALGAEVIVSAREIEGLLSSTFMVYSQILVLAQRVVHIVGAMICIGTMQ